MADEQTPVQTPTQNPAQTTAPVAQASFLDKLGMPLTDLWEKYRLFLIIFGILILIIKFRSVIIDLLISDSRKTLQDAQKQDSQLKAEESAANAEANALRQQANDLDKQKSNKVDEDWYKK